MALICNEAYRVKAYNVNASTESAAVSKKIRMDKKRPLHHWSINSTRLKGFP